MEKQRTESGHEQRDLNGKPLSVEVAVHQDRHQNGRAEHREHVLQSQKKHLRHPQRPGVINSVCLHLIVFAHQNPLFLFDILQRPPFGRPGYRRK